MPVDKLSPSSRQILFTAKRKAEKETLGLPTFAHLLASFSALKEEAVAQVIRHLDLKVERAALFQTAPLEEILNEALAEAKRDGSETVEAAHLFVSTLKNLAVAEPTLDQVRRELQRTLNEPEQDRKKKSLLARYTADLAENQPHVYLRAEVDDGLKVLLRKEKGNLVITGEKGVGKTAFVTGLSQVLQDPKAETRHPFLPKRILKFDASAFLADPNGSPENLLTALLEEAVEVRDAVLFFDDFHVFFTPSLTFHSFVPTLRGFLEGRRLRIIAALDVSEFNRPLLEEEFFNRYFMTLTLPPTTRAETLSILKRRGPEYAAFHRVKIFEGVLAAIADLSEIGGFPPNPEKALDLLDLAAVEASLAPSRGGRPSRLTLTEVAAVASRLSGIPLGPASAQERRSLVFLENVLNRQIIGQAEAVKAVVAALRKARLGLNEENRPLSSFLFLGPTGVGKTELARVLADGYFGSRREGLPLNLVKLDMSEFKERHTMSRLIGAPPGYVGFGQGGELTERVLKNPYSLVLVDEMEKAAPEVLNLFLQILDEGVLTDGMGQAVDFRHAIIIFTSNVGSDLIKKGILGFTLDAVPATSKRGPLVRGPLTEPRGIRIEEGSLSVPVEDASFDAMKNKLLTELKNAFKPEFLNRLDATVVFRQLSLTDVQKIARLELTKVAERFGQKGIELRFEPAAVRFLAKEGYSQEYGARYLKRTIENQVVDTLSGYLLSRRLKEGDKVRVSLKKRALNFPISHPTKKV